MKKRRTPKVAKREEKRLKGKQKAKIPEAKAISPTDQMIYIRVLQSLITTLDPVPDPSALRHLYLIQGSFGDIARYAGTTVNWIIKVANLICDPSGAGHIYTHTKGTSDYWYDKDRNPDWRQVDLGDPLVAGIYEFVTPATITISKISERLIHSLTSAGSESSAATFQQDLNLRDGVCVVSQNTSSLIASHLVPKRIGTEGAKEVVTRFVGAGAARGIHRFHSSLGILLTSTLDYLVDRYKVGFYHVTDDSYILHNFDNPNFNFLGTLLSHQLPDLHLFPVTLSPHHTDRNITLPPIGVFDWHYLQCVLLRFATDQYKQLPNIAFFVHAFKTADDESEDLDDFEDDINDEPPYPSYRFDRLTELKWEKHREKERLKEVGQWASNVGSEAE